VGRSSSSSLSAAEARRAALAAQQLDGRRGRGTGATPSVAALRSVAHRLQALQIDSVNIVVRAHYLPLYSRLGPYDVARLDRLTNERHDLIEHRFGHQASFVPVELEPFLRWRREDARQRWRSGWRASVDAAYVEAVERQVEAEGPLTLRDLEEPRRHRGPVTVRRKDGRPYAPTSLRWHRPSDGKTVLDGLLHEGRLALAGRRGVERRYDLSERVLPASVRSMPTPSVEDAQRELVRRAAGALGVATVADLADYFVLRVGDTRRAVHALVEEGALVPVAVEGWPQPAYAVAGLRVPRSVEGATLLGVFDSLTWSRDRTRRLFGFDFSFEIYVPEPDRRYGYYVLPFLLGDELVARVDLKADRARGRLVVLGAFEEAAVRAPAADVVGALRAELGRMAGWLGLESVEVPRAARGGGGRGSLASALRRGAGAGS
jgi:uncharacterized protein YcaQ